MLIFAIKMNLNKKGLNGILIIKNGILIINKCLMKLINKIGNLIIYEFILINKLLFKYLIIYIIEHHFF